MSAPQTYEDIRDNRNRKWICAADRGVGFGRSIDLVGDKLSIGYNCFEELSGKELRNEVEIYLSEYPRLESQIAKQLQDAVDEA